jgi:hypothetical protein
VYPRWLLATLRAFFQVSSAVSPRLAGRVALRLFSTPRRHHRPHWEKQIAERGATLRVGSNLAAHCWPVAAAHDLPTVLLVHGWEGRGTQMGRGGGRARGGWGGARSWADSSTRWWPPAFA